MTFYKPIISVPTFTVDNQSPFNLDISEPISENEEVEVPKTKIHVEPTVNQMILSNEFQTYVYLANSLNYRNQLHQLNKEQIFDKHYYLDNFQ
ncbi:hypothetical protein M9Y10_028975 [Tritrichomonas musculus]|uniref:Uncharacterized protein n=1 Tax=Tritrichomonas musculus TaxID=1915356 RepID=A0ABR2KP39_9EUKA